MYNFQCGNEPIGVFKYSENMGEEVVNEFSKIGKYCGVFKTYGDKRLGKK